MVSAGNTKQNGLLSTVCRMGYLWKKLCDFLEDQIAQRNCNIFGYFLLKQLVLHFSPNQAVFKHHLLLVLKGFNSSLDFLIMSFDVNILAIFGLATVLAIY